MNLSFTIYIDKNVINFLSYTSQTDCIHNNVHITNLYIYIYTLHHVINATSDK